MRNQNKVNTIKDIHDAIVDYISNNSTFESHEAINDVICKLGQATTLENIFRIPIDNRLFSFTNSLQWLYFICFIINIIKEEQISVPSSFNISFSTNSAIKYISNVYDFANETFYKDYFDNSDED